MLRILLIVVLTLHIWSKEPIQSVTENDPSSLVEGVSVITGDFYAFDEDYVVQGAEPIRLRRAYISREGIFRNYLHLSAGFCYQMNAFITNEPNGTPVLYFADPANKLLPVIGDQFFGSSHKKRRAFRYNAFSKQDKGTANTKDGEISGKSNLKNQYIMLDPKNDPKGKSFTLHASDGTIRRYVNFLNQEKTKNPYGGDYYLNYSYKLISETLPNGHMIHYRWNKKNQVERIYTTNAKQDKIFASIDIPSSQGKNPPTQIILKGSDQRFIQYDSHPTEIKRCYVLSKILSPDLPTQDYGWDVLTTWIGKEVKQPYLSSYFLPKNRYLYVKYSEDYEHRVQELRAPVGKDAGLITTHSFSYDIPNKTSRVLDVKGNRTDYYWNDDYRLVRIDRHVEGGERHSSDQFQWEGNLLKSKAFLDGDGKALFAHSYFYDAWGNVREKWFSGNLSGKAVPVHRGWEGVVQKSHQNEAVKISL